ncbi:baseplate J/gp47 family protein [Pseudomonas resinovorans]|uniref:baseplate assembly protein n=1 Tax=Metapseudomonas resinovorans TaxID=53412 RepID=UPI00237F9645|nr:baseplate J/gp47 family protein [Pseudomonas resinovorans]MDE3738583.1 baseplate J/gp47 family protein [Pseudomonas resinovorans]
MNSLFSPIDLSRLPAPDVIEALDFEQILAERKAYMIGLWPEEERAAIVARLTLESDPLNKLAQESAYRELLLRQRINDACRAVMLAFASGNDLDHLGALFELERQQLSPGEPDALPPVPPEYESDARFRQRIQLALEGTSSAGPVGAYSFHAFSASPLVKDVAITTPRPGTVRVTVLSTEGKGVPGQGLLDLVFAALNDQEVRPLCDTVEVVAASLVNYQVKARLTFYSGPDLALVQAAAEEAVRLYVDAHHRLGHDITRSGLFAALHQPGVQNVALTAPAADLRISDQQAGLCTGIVLEVGGIDV